MEMKVKSLRIAQRELDNEARTHARRASGRNTPPMPLNYLFTDGKAHARSLVLAALAVEPLEWGENPVEILFFKANAVVFNHDLKLAVIDYGAPHFDYRLLVLPVKLEGVADKILEKLPHLRRVGLNCREIFSLHFCAGPLDPYLQGRREPHQ